MTGGRWRARQLWAHVILLTGTVFLISPLVLMMIAATQSSASLQQNGLGFAIGSELVANSIGALSLKAGFSHQISLGGMMQNSVLVATSLASLTTAISLCAAYAIVYFKLPVAKFLFWATMLTLLLPLESRIVTTYQVAATLGLVNSLTGMVLPALTLALGTLFFRQLLLTFPDEYMEAARLDGAGPVRFFFDFVLPLSWRRAGAVFVVSFMIGWHQYLWPLILSTDESTYTIVRGIRLFDLQSGAGMALALVALLPPLGVVLVFQRFFFRSLSRSNENA